MKKGRKYFPLLCLLHASYFANRNFYYFCNFCGFFHKVIEKEKKMQQDAVYLNEMMRLYSMKKTTKMDYKFHPCSKLCKFIYSMFAGLH